MDGNQVTIVIEKELAAGFQAYTQRRYEDAHYIFRDVAFASPCGSSVQSVAVDAALFMLMKAGLKDLFPVALRELPDVDAKKQHSASFELFRGELNRFWNIIEDIPEYDSQNFGRWSRGISSLPETRRWPYLPSAGGRGEHFEPVALPAPMRSEMCIFSCDSRYFLEFADIPLLSARSVEWDCHFHFHIINPSDEALCHKDEMAQYSCASFSFEKRDITSKAYFASARYAIAEQAVREFGVPIWIMDIDLKFLRSPEKNFLEDGWSRTKVGVRYTQDIALPWQKMTANAMYVPATDLGVEYMRLVRAFLENAFRVEPEKDRDIWWVDQNAIFFALLACGGFNSDDFQVWGPRLDKTLSLPRIFEPRRDVILSR